jgi:hypothetical protein
MGTVKIHLTDDNAGFVVAFGVGLSVVHCNSAAERDGKGSLSLSENLTKSTQQNVTHNYRTKR